MRKNVTEKGVAKRISIVLLQNNACLELRSSSCHSFTHPSHFISLDRLNSTRFGSTSVVSKADKSMHSTQFTSIPELSFSLSSSYSVDLKACASNTVACHGRSKHGRHGQVFEKGMGSFAAFLGSRSDDVSAGSTWRRIIYRPGGTITVVAHRCCVGPFIGTSYWRRIMHRPVGWLPLSYWHPGW